MLVLTVNKSDWEDTLFAMKILLVGSFRWKIYAPAFENAFKQLKHEVISIDTESYCYKKFPYSNFLNRIQNHFLYGIPLIQLNLDIIKRVRSEHPDFIFLYHANAIWPFSIRKLRKEGVKIVMYNNDDPFCWVKQKHINKYYFWINRYFIRSIRYADINYVYRRKNIMEFNNSGSKCTKLLLPYYMSDINFHLKCDKDIPIAFIGHYENDGRDNYIKALVDNHIPIVVFGGSLWNKSAIYDDIKTVIKPGKYGEAYNMIMNRCQICLVFFSRINNDVYTRRCFEIPATKTLMLSEYTDEMNNLFPEDTCAVYFRNPDELVEKCRFLLKNSDVIDRIASNGNQRLKMMKCSEIDRCHEIIKDVEIITKY